MFRKVGFTAAMVATTAAGWAMGSTKLLAYEDELSAKYLLGKPEVQDQLNKLHSKGFENVAAHHSWLLESHRKYMFINTVLTGPSRLHPEGPLTLKNPKTGEIVNIFHVGEELKSKDHFRSACTVLFDECLAQAAFTRLPNKVGVTATLSIGPVHELSDKEELVILVSHPTESNGRKAHAVGTLKSLSTGKVLAEGKAMFIEPKWGKYLSWLTL